MSARLQGYLFLALAMATVGSTVIASKLIAGALPPFTATALRFALALPVLLLIVAATGVRLPRLDRRAWALLALQAGAGSVGYTTLLISGLAHLPAADAGVVIGTLPAVSAAFSVIVLGERPDLRILASVLLATAGVLVVTLDGVGPRSGVGIILVLGAVVCESAFILLNKRMAAPLPPLWQATVMTGLGLGLALPVALLEGWPAVVTQSALGAVVWYALVPTVGGFLLWYAGAARVSGSEAAVFTAVAPVTAVLLPAAVLGEPIGGAEGIGLATVALAILVLALPRPNRSATP